MGDLKGLLSLVWEENYFSRDFGGQLEAELDIHGREKIFTTKLPCEKITRNGRRSATRRTSLSVVVGCAQDSCGLSTVSASSWWFDRVLRHVQRRRSQGSYRGTAVQCRAWWHGDEQCGATKLCIELLSLGKTLGNVDAVHGVKLCRTTNSMRSQ